MAIKGGRMKEEGGRKRELEDWRIVLSSPRGPRSELKEAATTTVGSKNGTAVRARRRDLPRKSKREKRMAEGIPRKSVRRVERTAW